MSQLTTSRLYNDVNFLPAWYVQARGRKRSLQRSAMLSLIVIVGMVMLLVQTWHRQSELTHYAAELQRKLESTQMQITEATKLRQEKVDLDKQLRVHRQLHRSINYSQVAGTLASLMPPAVSLTDMELSTDRVTTTQPISSGDPRYASMKATMRGSAQPTITITRNVVSIEVMGVSPTDKDIANFIGELVSSNLFQNVKMMYSKQGQHSNLITRDFRIHMEVPLDRKYADGSASQEVAGAH